MLEKGVGCKFGPQLKDLVMYIGNSKTIARLCIVILKKDVPRLGMPSSRRVGIFTQSKFEPMVFSK
jgi:hypothetical protein